MARELATEVDRLLASMNPNIRKKAAMCAAKMIRKDPELMDIFEERVTSLLGDRNHAVILGGIEVARECLLAEGAVTTPNGDSLLTRYRRMVPSLVRLAQSILSSSYNPEYDVSGICDPMLQIQLLRLLRILGHGDAASSDVMNDLLAQLATGTDASKNAGNAVLYEVVLTIMHIHADQSLKNLAVNILGRFLDGSDNNLRFVALNLLHRILSTATVATTAHIQRHRTTVLACLHDPDPSICKKAADIALLLITPETLSMILPELLAARSRSPSTRFPAHTRVLLHRLALAIIQHAPSPIVLINALVRLLRCVQTDNPYCDEIVAVSVATIARFSPKMHTLAVKELFFALTVLEDRETTVPAEDEDALPANIVSPSSSFIAARRQFPLPSEGLLQVAFWCFGEFGAALPVESLCSATQLIDLLAAFILPGEGRHLSLTTSQVTRAYGLAALAKLSTRLPDQLIAIQAALKTAETAFMRTGDFVLLDRARELSVLVADETLRVVVFAPALPGGEDGGDGDGSRDPHNGDTGHEDQDTATSAPDFVTDHLVVSIRETQHTGDGLAMQWIATARTAVQDVTIALAVSRDFELEYTNLPTRSAITDPATEQITFAVLVRHTSPVVPETNLLDLSDTPPVSVDWSACLLKIRVAYRIKDSPTLIEQTGQISRLPVPK